MLDFRKQQLIQLKMENPMLTNGEIASQIGVSRQTIWEWLKDSEVRAELDRRLQAVTQNANLRLRTRVNDLMGAMLHLALDEETEARVRNSALQYLIDRSMGKAADNVNIDLKDETDAAEVLKGFKEFLEKGGYYKEETENV